MRVGLYSDFFLNEFTFRDNSRVSLYTVMTVQGHFNAMP